MYPGSLAVFQRNMENDLGTYFKTQTEKASRVLRAHIVKNVIDKNSDRAFRHVEHMYETLMAMESTTTEKLSEKVLAFRKGLGNLIRTYESFRSGSGSNKSDLNSSFDKFDLLVSDPYLWRDDVDVKKEEEEESEEEKESMDLERGEQETSSSIRTEMTKALLEGSPSSLLQIVQSVYRFVSRLIAQYRRSKRNTPCVISLQYLRQSLLLNYPQSTLESVLTHDNLKLDCVYIPSTSKRAKSRKTKKIVLMCNPNAGLYENVHDPEQSPKLRHFLKRGLNVFVWNYRGYGRSEGTPSPLSNNKDILAVLDHLVQRFHSQGENVDIAVSAESIGGLTGCYIACERPDIVKLLIADRTFGSLHSTASYVLAPWAGRVLRFLKWNGENTDSFLRYSGMKIVCNDTDDAIIHNMASLKTSIANAVELGCDYAGRELKVVEEEEDVVPTTPVKKGRNRKESESNMRTLRRRTPIKKAPFSFLEYDLPGSSSSSMEESNSKSSNLENRDVRRLTEANVQMFHEVCQRFLARAVLASSNPELRRVQYGGTYKFVIFFYPLTQII